MRVQFWETELVSWMATFFFLKLMIYLFIHLNILKEIVDRYEGKIWEDFFTKHFEQVSVCMSCQSKLLQSYYVAL